MTLDLKSFLQLRENNVHVSEIALNISPFKCLIYSRGSLILHLQGTKHSFNEVIIQVECLLLSFKRIFSLTIGNTFEQQNHFTMLSWFLLKRWIQDIYCSQISCLMVFVFCRYRHYRRTTNTLWMFTFIYIV